MMKKIRTLMIALALFIGATTAVTAQVKVAHIDVQKLLEEMPERKSVEAQLKKLEQSYTNDIQAAIKELQARAEKYQKEIAALTEAQLKARETEFLKKTRRVTKDGRKHPSITTNSCTKPTKETTRASRTFA